MSQMIESFMNGPTARPRVRPVQLDDAGTSEPAGAALLRDASPLHGVKVRLDVCVGRAVVSIGELLTARVDQVVVLDSRVDQPVDVMLEGKVVARGELVAVDDGSFAIRVTELPVPLKI